MPIYEYLCPSCQRRFERMRPRSEATEPAPCPDCGTTSPRAISSFAFVGAESEEPKVKEGPASELPDMDSLTGHGHSHGHGHGHDHDHFH